MAEWLTAAQRETLTLICDTFVPSLSGGDEFLARSASDLGVPAVLERAMGEKPARLRTQFVQLLDILGGRLADFSLKTFAERTPQEREKLLRHWSESPLGLQRQGYHTLKQLTMLIFYSLPDQSRRNPNWSAINYPGPQRPPSGVAPTLTLTELDGQRELVCDTVVVGSGAGGSIVAEALAQAGANVIILEKGDYVDQGDFDQLEWRGLQTMYEAGGLMTSEDGGISVIAGSTIGGGTTINWAGSFRTPDYVLEEWAKLYGLKFVQSAAYEESFTAVERRLDVDTRESHLNQQNQALWRGALKLGWQVKAIPRNVRGCHEADCGYCGFGCPHGAKQSAISTYLKGALAHGATLCRKAEARRVLIENGKATGVEAIIAGRPVTIRARLVISSAGALHTPALLLRSGLKHPQLGRHLALHPTVALGAFYPHPMEAWHGVMMAAVCDEFARLDETWGVKIETPPAHAGMMGFALPWMGGAEHKVLMRRVQNLGFFIIITRDRFGGRVTIDREGHPVVSYRLNDYDRRNLWTGVQAATRLHEAAGAEEVVFPQSRHRRYLCGQEPYERAMRRMEGWGWKANDFILFSAHQMGSCRMGANPTQAVLNTSAESYEVKNLFVSDASLFPSASGANPMLSIQALCHYLSQGVVARL